MKTFTAILLVAMAGAAMATPMAPLEAVEISIARRQADPASQLIAIAPLSANCSPDQKECITAAVAVQPIIRGFKKYGITTAAEQAGLLALMAFETGDFVYDTSQENPPTPGQGTRNMMMPNFVLEYAIDLGVVPTGSADAVAALSRLNADNDMSLGSAAWYYSTKCTAVVKTALQLGSDAGFLGLMSDCVKVKLNTSSTEYTLRMEKWHAATAALGVLQ